MECVHEAVDEKYNRIPLQPLPILTSLSSAEMQRVEDEIDSYSCFLEDAFPTLFVAARQDVSNPSLLLSPTGLPPAFTQYKHPLIKEMRNYWLKGPGAGLDVPVAVEHCLVAGLGRNWREVEGDKSDAGKKDFPAVVQRKDNGVAVGKSANADAVTRT